MGHLPSVHYQPALLLVIPAGNLLSRPKARPFPPSQTASSRPKTQHAPQHRHLDRSALSERSESNGRAVERPAVRRMPHPLAAPSLLVVIPAGNLLFASEPMSIRSHPPTHHPSIPNPSSRPKRSKLHNHRHLDRSALSERSESNGRAVERPAVQDAASACGSFLLLVIPAGNLLFASAAMSIRSQTPIHHPERSAPT